MRRPLRSAVTARLGRPAPAAKTAVAAVAVLALLAMLSLLSGCAAAGGLVGVQAAPKAASDGTAVEPQQARGILGRILDQAGKADAAKAADQAVATYTGPALAIAKAAYTVDAALGTPVPGRPASRERPQVLLTRGTGYPRWFLGVLTGTRTQAAQVTLLTTSDAGTPYRLWGSASLLPGRQLPALPNVSDGSSQLDPAAGGLVVTPGDVGAQYAALLNNGSSAPQSATFSADPFAQQVQAAAAAQRLAVARFGSYVQAQVADPTTWAIRTSDGGALVVTSLKRVSTFTARSGNAATLPSDVRVLTGLVQAGTFVSTSEEVLVFNVPRAGKGRVELVAASDGLVSATAH